jgi:hypothetical protein
LISLEQFRRIKTGSACVGGKLARKTAAGSANIFPFSPFSPQEEALFDAYVGKKDPKIPEIAPILDELGAEDVPDLNLTKLDVAAGLLIAKYIGDASLPTWGSPGEDGKYHYTRGDNENAQKARRLLSITLLRINWAMSGPGFDWPEEYRVTWLPRQERWILTSSRDSTDLFGVMDMALGHFKSERDRLVEKARPVLIRYWRMFLQVGQPPWVQVLRPGLVGTDVACHGAKGCGPAIGVSMKVKLDVTEQRSRQGSQALLFN